MGCFFGWVYFVLTAAFMIVPHLLKPKTHCPVCWYDMIQPPESHRISASALWLERKSGLQAADAKFRGKVAIVNGILRASDKLGGRLFVVLSVEDDEALGVRCYLPASMESKLRRYVIGDPITVIGTVRELGDRGIVVDGTGVLDEINLQHTTIGDSVPSCRAGAHSGDVRHFCGSCGRESVTQEDRYCRFCGARYTQGPPD